MPCVGRRSSALTTAVKPLAKSTTPLVSLVPTVVSSVMGVCMVCSTCIVCYSVYTKTHVHTLETC